MTFDPAAVFNREFDKAIGLEVARSGFPVPSWFKAGRTQPEDSVTQWRTRGPELVGNFTRWWEASGAKVWIAPDGRPAIELELRVMFGTVEVVMFVDLVVILPIGLVVVDLKSGSTDPDSSQQLALYACGIELAFGREYRPLWGSHFMARGRGAEPVYFQEPEALDDYRYSVAFFTRELTALDRAVRGGIFPASPSDACRRCPVSYACLAVGGTDARKYDPAHPDYVPPPERPPPL